jgi:hypothetical protein
VGDCIKKQKALYEVTKQFKVSWSTKLSRVECMKDKDDLYDFVKCIVFTHFEHNENILLP